MADERPELTTAPLDAEAVRGAVIVGVVPDQNPRVVKEAAKFAAMMKAPLVVAHVDVTRFDGYVHTAPIDVNIAPGEADIDLVRASVAHALEGIDVDWRLHQLVGDPALALKHLAEQVDARLLVVGTRKRGIGESIREFFTGSVAARLAHRQARPILVVPLGEPAPDDEDLWPTS